jgi:UDP-N-acetylmuramoyl-L-alanine--D-glutamate ligase
VKEVSGVRFYDDSIATTPGSAIAALNAFSQPKILILGGSDKGADLSELIDKISNSSEGELREVILMGAESSKLAQKLTQAGFERFINLGQETNMQEVVKASFENAQSGDVVILSPAHASFDMFKSYTDRGEQFIENVNLL